MTEVAGDIFDNDKLDAAIDYHETLIRRLFENKKLFYKSMFRNSRFMVANVFFAFFYSRKNCRLKEVKDFILEHRMISRNSLEGFITFARVTGRMSVQTSVSDRRQLTFAVTTKAQQEASELVDTMIRPLTRILHRDALRMPYSLHQRKRVLERYCALILNNIHIAWLIPEINIFIRKDSGHMVILGLWQAIRESVDNISDWTLLQLANYSGVSRSHIKNILTDAEYYGLITIRNNGMVLHPELIALIRRYFSYYFALVSYSLE